MKRLRFISFSEQTNKLADEKAAFTFKFSVQMHGMLPDLKSRFPLYYR